MTDHSNGADASESTDSHTRRPLRITSCTIDGQTVVFDVDDDDRWIRSDTAVELATHA